MSASILKERLFRQPFEPFRVRLSNGQAYEVRHPEMALLYKSGLYVGVPQNSDDLAEEVVWCSLLHIAAVEPVGSDSPAS
ncbi:MAG: hypothetical protein AAGJ46_20180 [Planctomycetota bacterium]